MYYLCEKYHKPITVQYYIDDCVSWVPGLTFWTYDQTGLNECTLKKEPFVYRGLAVFSCIHYLQPSRPTIVRPFRGLQSNTAYPCYLVGIPVCTAMCQPASDASR